MSDQKLLLQRCSVSVVLSNARAILQREDPALYTDDGLPEDAIHDPRDDDEVLVALSQNNIGAAGPEAASGI